MDELAAGIMAGLAVYLVICLILCVIMIIANWKIFTKAGEAGWKSIIPILNTFVIFKISWKTSMFWAWLGTLIASSVFASLAGGNGGVLSVIGIICSIASGVIGIIDVHKLSKSFGHGIGFTLGLIFLSPIFTLILAFGSSEYIGPDGGEY
jgi:hypothetical protein